MTELEFKQKCKDENINITCFFSESAFLKYPNILGCNKEGKSFIIYFTRANGSFNYLCSFDNEECTFEFLYKLLQLRQKINSIKEEMKTKVKM